MFAHQLNNINFKMLVIFILLCSSFCHCATIPEVELTGCPAGYENHPLILVSMDGFRPDYLNRGITPNLLKLQTEGVSTPYMRASFPTVTFPNHYTIATGLYPESHGIIANTFSDTTLSTSRYDFSFSKYVGSLANGMWFGGEPIWNTVIKNGMKSATYFWIGSEAEIGGIRPTYYYPYDSDTPFEDRITKVLEWLKMPLDSRPSWIAVYFNQPDRAGHTYGPQSPEVDVQIERVDGIIQSLVEGIDNLNLTKCVNVIIVSDHGMAEAGEEKVINLEDYQPDLEDTAEIVFGSHSRLRMREGFEDEKINVLNSLACENDNMKQFDKISLPKRFHYSNNPRIEDIVFSLSPGYVVNSQSDDSYRNGEHGYDNYFVTMQALFIASGPDFKERTVIHPFQNIELYNLMCDLLNVEPAMNNGTKGALYHIMKNPPNYPKLSVGETPKIAVFPDKDAIPELLTTTGCRGDLTSAEDWIFTLDVGEDMEVKLNSLHMPFGPPVYDSSLFQNVTLLYHSDHITGFSPSLKLPVWTSFTFNSKPTKNQEKLSTENQNSLWSSDVRLSAADSPKCIEYGAKFETLSMQPLFRSEYSQEDHLTRIPFLTSNAIPITDELELRYRELMIDLVPMWQELHGGPVNVIVGPVFDNDFNSIVDDFPVNNGSPISSLTAPSDIFVIATLCMDKEIQNLRDCTVDELQVTSFIYRQTQTSSNCLDKEQYAEEFSARVKDIELSTGLVFFSDLGYKDAINLALRQETILLSISVADQLIVAGSAVFTPSVTYLCTLISTLLCVYYYVIKSL